MEERNQMKTKKNKADEVNEVQQKDSFVEEIKKSQLQANSRYEYQKIAMPNTYFMDCTIEEEKESLKITYQIGEMRPVLSLKAGNKLKKIEVLIQAGKLEELSKEYAFLASPNNLYYDAYGQLKVMRRDIQKNRTSGQKEFLDSYRALVGALLSTKYSYEDVLQGGQSLLADSKELQNIATAKTVDEVKVALDALYKKTAEQDKRTTLKVNRKKYQGLIIYTVISILATLALGTATVYAYMMVMPKERQIILASDAYIEADYVKVIDELKRFEIEELDKHQKYILALSYIHSQSIDTFRGTEKEAVLSKISYNGNEEVLEYWIHLGRLEMDEAQSMAMKLSDNQLLLYAYIQELNQVEKDQSISGTEKSERSKALMTNITTLANTLGIDYEEKTLEEQVEETEIESTETENTDDEE